MSKYLVTVTKIVEIEVDAENKAAAEQIARDQEADGILGFDMQVEVRPVAIDTRSNAYWARRLDDECNVSIYQTGERFGFTGCESDDYESYAEALEAALMTYGLIGVTP